MNIESVTISASLLLNDQSKTSQTHPSVLPAGYHLGLLQFTLCDQLYLLMSERGYYPSSSSTPDLPGNLALLSTINKDIIDADIAMCESICWHEVVQLLADTWVSPLWLH